MKPSNENTLVAFTPYQKLVIAILAILQFTVVLDFMILSPLGDILMKSLNISPSGFGLVVSCYAFSAGISGILAAGFADKFDRKKLLLFFYAGFILGTLFCGLADTYYLLLAARIVTGLFGGVIGSISLAIVTDLFEINQRGRVMGTVQMAFAASQVLGIPVGIFIANHFGWHSTFLMIVAVAAMVYLLMWIKMKPVDSHLSVQSERNAFQHLLGTVSKSNYVVAFAATAFLSVGGFMLMPFGSAYLVNNIGISQTQLPLVFMLTGLSSIVIMPLIGRISDKIDKFLLFCAGSVLAIVMIVIYTNLERVPLWEVIVVNMILFIGIMSRMIPATALTTGVPDMKDRGAFMSVNSSLQQMAGGLAAVVAGLIVSQETEHSPLENYDTLGLVVSAIVVLCAFFVYQVSKISGTKAAPQKREVPEPVLE